MVILSPWLEEECLSWPQSLEYSLAIRLPETYFVDSGLSGKESEPPVVSLAHPGFHGLGLTSHRLSPMSCFRDVTYCTLLRESHFFP
jgi:hypothetical protein